MELFKAEIEKLRQRLLEALNDFPMELDLPPTPCVIDLGSERDGMDILGRVNIVRIGPDGKIWDDEGNEFTVNGGQSPYSIEDIMELHRVVLETAQKKLSDAGFNPEE